MPKATPSKVPASLRPVWAWIKRHPHLCASITLLALGLISRFWLFGYPNSAVFDEVYFGKFVSSYFTHKYFFDIHPPGGKLLIAGFAWLLGYQPSQSFATIGTVYTDNTYLMLRFLPSLAGALLPFTLYSLGRELGLKTRTALVIGMATVSETALLTQSRFILIDSFLLLFGFASIWSYFVWRRRSNWLALIGTAVFAGLAISIKWTGLTFLALPLIYEYWQQLRSRKDRKVKSHFARLASTVVLIAGLIYISFFAVHLALLNQTGDGDAFMSPGFQKTLHGSTFETDAATTPLGLQAKIIELNYQMYDANARLIAGHPYGSKWYTWPFMLRPISYWVDGEAQIWLFGNPLVWWGSTVGLIYVLIQLIRRRIPAKLRLVTIFLIGAWLLNYLPFIGIARVMFLYHYLIALCWALLITGVGIDKLSAKHQAWMVAAMAAGFFVYAPFSYGISPSAISTGLRTLLPSWR